MGSVVDGSCPATAPRLLLDAQRAVVWVNPAACRWMAAQPGTLSVQHGRLLAPGQRALLDPCLAQAAAGLPAAMLLPRRGRWAATLRADPWPSAGSPAGVVVTLRDPELELPDPDLLRGLYGFTPTEARVAAALAQGLDGADLARAMSVQPNTVRSHVKRALAKCGARRQSQLVSLILRSVAMRSAPAPERGTAAAAATAMCPNG